jgi:hypothetical protein
MNRSTKWCAAIGCATLVTLLWPGPAASADTSLGGYTGSAQGAVVRVQVFEPTIPIPTPSPDDPQLDFSLGYTNATVDSGPTSRALASYLWPGVVIGDGFEQLVNQPGAKYPVQVNSRYPATQDAPATNAQQVAAGNGMSTSTDGLNTIATVSTVGIGSAAAGSGGGLSGIPVIGGLLGSLPGAGTGATSGAATPVPISPAAAGIATAQNVTSTSTTTVADKTLTSTAVAAASDISLLGGIIRLSGVKATSQVVSDGTNATPTGSVTIGGMSIAGQPIGLGDKGLQLGPVAVPLPDLGSAASGLLKTLGISFSTTPMTKTVSGASGEFHAQGLVITLDTAPFKQLLAQPLNMIVSLLGTQAAQQLAPIIGLAPKFRIIIGDADATAVAAPAYVDDSSGAPDTSDSGTDAGSAVMPGDTSGSGSGGVGSGLTGGGSLPGSGPGASSVVQPVSLQQAGLHLPALGAVPRMLILGGLLLAAVLGWLLRGGGLLLLGGARNCHFGLATGVPDLRKV